jgi:hypothetical protein
MSSSRRAALASLLLVLGARAVSAEEPPAALSAPDLLVKVAPAVVNVRYVLKWADGEMPYHAVATVVDPSGLLVLGNDYSGSGAQKATDLKVTFAGDAKDREAVVVARDRVLNLAWLQVLGLDAPVAALDLSVGSDPVIGQDLQSVWRTGRAFDHAAATGRHYVVARVEKPRPMWQLGGDTPLVGAPVLDAAGRPVGVSATQSGSASDDDEEGGGEGTFLLPLEVVRKSLAEARKRVPEAVEKAKTAPAEAPAAPKDAPPAAPPDAAPAKPTEPPVVPAPEQPA